MKVNKITTFVCFIIAVINGALILIFKGHDLLQNIFSGVLTGIIASCVIALIGYFHERAIIIEAISANIRSLFLNITIMSKILGQALPQVHNSVNISDLQFKNVVELATLNSEFIEKMNLGLYNPFCPRSKKSNVCKRLNNFKISIYTMKNISSNLELQVLKYDIDLLEVQKNKMMGAPTDTIQQSNLDEQKYLININTAKFQEYLAAQLLEIAEIGREFYGYKKKQKQLAWDDIEKDLLSQAERIVKGDIV